MKYPLVTLFLGTLCLVARGADPAAYTASAAPGANPDANAGAASVWKIQSGSQTGAGESQLGSDPHMWQIFCLQAGDNDITQTHTFVGGALTAGQQVSLDYAYNTNIDSGKRVGIRLLDADGKTEVEFAFPGGAQSFVYTDAAAKDAPTGEAYNAKNLLHFSLKVTGPHSYSASCDENNWSGTFNDPLAQIQVFDAGGGQNSDQYTDNLAISQEKPIELDHAAQIGAGEVLFVPKGYDASKVPSLAFVTPPQEQGAPGADSTLTPKFYANGGSVGATLDVPAGTSLYGTGEVTGPLLRNGKSIALWNTDNFCYQKAGGHRLYQSHPWVLGVRPDGTAFGILFDTTWKATLSTQSDRIDFLSEGGPFRVVIIDRKSPQEVVEGLADLTGKMPLPPKWALGFHQCRYSYFPDSKVREIADHFRKDNLPCDVIWLDIHYMDNYRIFTFDPKRFPDPKATNDYLHQLHFHSVWMIDPGVAVFPGYSVYDSGKKADVYTKNKDGADFIGKVWPGDCHFPDFTRPETRDWWGGLYKDYIATGIDGVWNDMNEPSVFDQPSGTMPEDNQHRGGGDLPAGPHKEYHNVYGMLMVSATRKGILEARPDVRPFVLTRSNYLGGQRYAATWTGDNNSAMDYLKMSLPMVINLGLSGQPLSGPDIGGYSGDTTPELYGKWIAMEPFYPFSRAHTSVDNPPREPWAQGPEMEKVARTALDRRYRMLPYIYTLAYNASQTGDPIMRPVFFADPKDVALRDEQQAFLFGGDLLVVPKWAEDPKLPKGIWRQVSLIDEKQEDDGYQATVKIRGGAIVPLGKIIQNTSEKSLDPLTLLVCLDDSGKASGTLYEDAGEGFGYQKGDYAVTHYVATREGNEIKLRIATRDGKLAVPDRKVQVSVITDSGVLKGSEMESKGIVIDAKP
jgi:alpha-glucosidase